MCRSKQFLVISFLALLAASLPAQSNCQFGGEKAADDLVQALTKEPSCSKASELLDECLWGSSADAQFASIVVDKCEKTFLSKFTPAEKTRYRQERGLCAYEFARQEGTIALSENYVCQADVAAQFAANPAMAKQPFPRASFECAKAKTALERAICADKKLGEADIVLGRSYKAVLGMFTGPNRATVVGLQKTWLNGVLRKCAVGRGHLFVQQRDCVRNEFETRFMDLDGCGVGGPDECLRQLQPSPSHQ